MKLDMASNLSIERTTFQFFWEDSAVSPEFRSGVSLHSHTMYSEEGLETLPRYVDKVPLLKRALGASIDYGSGFWTPPLSPRQAHRLEEKQIGRRFQLPGLVSLSDHDDMRAGSMLRVLPRFQNALISVEWTVAFGPTFFHIGVHNLPAESAPELMGMLRGFTAAPRLSEITPCLERLHKFQEVLLVLNHPLWDENQIGKEEHRNVLSSFLRLTGNYLHALEVNGLRPLAENREVIQLGSRTGLPIVSGGDRHGCEPNAILNLTSATTFSEFVDEVRTFRRSHVVFMPQYRQSVAWRTTQMVVDILKDYPGSFEGRRVWGERVFCRQPNGEAVCISSLWPNGKPPKIFSAVTGAVRLAQWRSIRSAMKTVLSLGPRSEVAI